MKRSIALIAVGALFVLALIGDGAAVALWLRSGQQPAVAKKDKHTASKKASTNEPLYFASIKNFVVSLPANSNGDGPTYVQIGLSFATHDKKAVAEFDHLMPIIKSNLIALAVANASTLESNRAKAAHAIPASALPIVNKVMQQDNAKLGQAPFIGAYLTDLIIQ